MRNGSLGPLRGGRGFGGAVEADGTSLGHAMDAEVPTDSCNLKSAALAPDERDSEVRCTHVDAVAA
jgi:hypothetical protein